MSGRLSGYPKVVGRIQRELVEGLVSHAYLVLGPPQVGKMVLALDLAQALNCEGPDAPCGRCPHCQKTVDLAHPDVQVLALLVDQKSERYHQVVGIDQVRALQRDASLHPYWGKYRVFIIDGAQQMSTEAANCLLKTLEEPPPSCIIILLALEENDLPATIISRCRKVYLRPLPVSQVERILLEQGTAPEEALLLSRLSGGRLGWALAARGDTRLMSARSNVLVSLRGSLGGGMPERFHLAEEMAGLFYKDRSALERALQIWLGWARDLLLVRGGFNQGISNVDEDQALSRWSERLSDKEILAFVKAVISTLECLERNVSPRLALDALMLQAPHRGAEV